MQPLQKISEHTKVNPELYKTNYVYVHHEDLINNDPMTGVRGVNIEKQQQLNQEKLYSLSPRLSKQVKTSTLTTKGDVSSPNIQDVVPWDQTLNQKSPNISKRQMEVEHYSDSISQRDLDSNYEDEEKPITRSVIQSEHWINKIYKF